jgi:DNA-binding PadR family transcriptional regulator
LPPRSWAGYITNMSGFDLRQGQVFVRTRPGSDKRTRIVSVTKKGERLLTNARPRWDEAQKTLLDLIGDRRWTVMRSLLKDTTRLVRHRARHKLAKYFSRPMSALG